MRLIQYVLFTDEKTSKGEWSQWEEENFLQRMEEFYEFARELKSEEKLDYFRKFIR